jgi:hypothetical protein
METIVGFEALTVADSVKTLTSSVYAPSGNIASRALISAENGDFRYKVDGNSPSATEGHLVAAGDIIELGDAVLIQNFKAIRTGTISGKISVTYFG